MLILGLDPGEAIYLLHRGVRSSVTLGSIRGDVVRLGFDAPKEVVILREAVYEGIVAGMQAATGHISDSRTQAVIDHLEAQRIIKENDAGFSGLDDDNK